MTPMITNPEFKGTGGVVFPDESYRIMGACFEVHNEKGSGFLEAVYQECLALEFARQGIPAVAQAALPLTYKGTALQQIYRADFVCFGKIVVELKTVERIADEHVAQVLNYLNATGYELGLLINFAGHPKLESRRIVRSAKAAPIRLDS